jgi:CBS domain-containing protein
MHAVDVMSRSVVTVRVDDSVVQAAAVLTTNNITSASSVNAAGELVGIVNEGDVLRGRAPPDTVATHAQRRAEPRPAVVADVMTTNLVVMPVDADLADVAEAMLHDDVRSVPVVDDLDQTWNERLSVSSPKRLRMCPQWSLVRRHSGARRSGVDRWATARGGLDGAVGLSAAAAHRGRAGLRVGTEG